MLNNLIESESKGLGWLKNPWVIILSVAVHVALLGALVWAASVEEVAAKDEIDPEDVTFIDVTEIPPPPEPEPVPEQETPRAQPQQPQQQAAAPPQRQPRRAPPEVTEPDQPAGFQELQAPDELAGIPEPAPSQEEVRAEDFGGRGAAGGVSGGEPAEETGGGAAGGQGEAGGVAGGTYTANMVDRAVSLRNGSELQTEMKRRYPSHLRDAGVGGRVMAQFVVDENGRVEAGSIRIISAQHPDLGEQTRQALKKARFTPAKKGDRNVRQLVRMPIVWQPDA